MFIMYTLKPLSMTHANIFTPWYRAAIFDITECCSKESLCLGQLGRNIINTIHQFLGFDLGSDGKPLKIFHGIYHNLSLVLNWLDFQESYDVVNCCS